MNYGLRAMMGELIPAFSGISEKIIPNSRPALDVPTVFPFGSNSVLFGSSLTILFFIVYMLVFRFTGFATIFPLVASLFMSGAGVAVFANKKGGLRGVIISSLIVATIMAFRSRLLRRSLVASSMAWSTIVTSMVKRTISLSFIR